MLIKKSTNHWHLGPRLINVKKQDGGRRFCCFEIIFSREKNSIFIPKYDLKLTRILFELILYSSMLLLWILNVYWRSWRRVDGASELTASWRQVVGPAGSRAGRERATQSVWTSMISCHRYLSVYDRLCAMRHHLFTHFYKKGYLHYFISNEKVVVPCGNFSGPFSN